jgi:hypothetical protein
MRRAVALGAVLLALASVSPAAAQDIPATTVPPTAPTVPQTSAAPTTVPTQVLGVQELNDDGELALTGLDAGALAGFGLALVASGSAAAVRSRRF